MSKIPPNIIRNEDYLTALEELRFFHQDPVGLTDYLGQSQSDKIYPKQHNIEIALLIKILDKLNNIERRIERLENNKSIEEITKKFSEIPVDRKEKKKVPESYKYIQNEAKFLYRTQ